MTSSMKVWTTEKSFGSDSIWYRSKTNWTKLHGHTMSLPEVTVGSGVCVCVGGGDGGGGAA